MYRENVLNGTKCVLFPILYRRNVLGGTKWIFASRIVRRGRVRRSDSSAQVLRNSRPEFRLLPLRDSMLFGYCLVAGRRLLPSERIAQHLSEWAQTAAGIHDQNAARFAEIRLCVYCRSCWFRSMILCKNFFTRVTLASIVI